MPRPNPCPGILNWICRRSLRRPEVFLIISLLLSVPFSAGIRHLKLDTDLIRLLPADSRAVRLQERMNHLAPGEGSYFTLLLESPDRDALISARDEALNRLRAVTGIGSLHYRNPAEFYRRYRYLLLDSRKLEEVHEALLRMEARVNPMSEDLLGMDDEDPKKTEREDSIDLRRARSLMDMPDTHISRDGTVAAIRVFPDRGITSLGKTRRIYADLEETAAGLTRDYPVWCGIGGSLRNSMVQYDFIVSDLARSGGITLILIVICLLAGFLRIRSIPLLLAPLLLGMYWTLGVIPLLTSNLNTVTAFLLLVSLGLGIDFSIHLTKRFQQEWDGENLEIALMEAMHSSGQAIRISALTTSIALFILTISNFRGFSEFGLIGGVSILLILAAVYLILPAILVLGARFRMIKPLAGTVRPRRIPRKSAALAFLLLTGIAAIIGMAATRFNFDFSRMDVNVPGDREIRRRYYKVYDTGRSPAALFACPDLDSLDSLINHFNQRKPDSRIRRISSIRDLAPDKEEARRRMRLLGEIRSLASGRWTRHIKDPEYRRALEDLRAWRTPSAPPSIDDVPKILKSRLVSSGDDPHFMVAVYILGEKQKGLNAMAFTRELYEIDKAPGVIGPFGETTVLAEVLEIVTREGIWLLLAALAGILIIILAHQRSLRDAAWIMVPLVTGLALTLGIMALAGIRFNFFNVVVFPALVGMGVDDGVHYFRRWRELRGDTPLTQGELHGPLSLTTLTTICGYGGIAFSHHPGLKSIGVLAVIGLLATWAATLYLLPGLLASRRESRSISSGGSPR